MKFNTLYRDVYSQLNLDGSGHEIYFQDITKAINDSIRNQRRQYIDNGLGKEFTTTETLDSLTEDTEYSFLNTDTLTTNIMDSVGIEKAVISIIGFETDKILEDQAQSFSKGDIVLKGGKIYECLNDITNENTYDLTIPSKAMIRDFYEGNGLRYYEGEFIYDVVNKKYYKVTADYDNDTVVAATAITEFTEYFWIEKRKSFVTISKYPFYAITHLAVFDEYSDSQGIVVNKDKVYATKGLNKIVITYVPEWTEVDDLDTEIEIPDFMIPAVKSEAINKLRTKLYKRYAPNSNPEQLEEDEQDN